MKKLILFVLIAAVALSLCACGKNTKKTDSSSASTSTTEQTNTTLPTTTKSTTEGASENKTEAQTKAVPVPVTAAQKELQSTRTPLKLQSFVVTDPSNSRGLDNKTIANSYGLANNGQANSVSINYQKEFENKGYNAVCLDTKSNSKVLYLTFDCGYENGYTAKILDTLKQKGVTAAFFCTLPQVKQNPQLINRMIDEGHIVGNHSNTHPSFPSVSRTEMMNEIKAMDDYLRLNFGYSEPYFRYPKGEYSENSMDLVNSLGYKCVFWSCAYADWDLNNQKGADYAFNTVTARLHPGAIILLHSVSPDNANALGRIIDYAKEQGYCFKSLNDL